MFYLGCHLSSSDGFYAMGETALSIGANTFQFFTRNPRGGSAKAFDSKDAERLEQFLDKHSFGPILAHAPYTMNPCALDSGLREFAETMMKDDLFRMNHFENSMYNFHPGSHVKQGVSVAIDFIASMLNRVLSPSQNTLVLLETMSGKGTEVGSCFEELQSIIEKVECSEKLGVCLDTCHVYDAGYDIVNHLDDVLDEFDKIIGLSKLKAIHLNDSKNPFESHKDRHETIANGSIGLEGILRIINHPKLKSLPFFLETPNELPGYASEIKMLRERYEG